MDFRIQRREQHHPNLRLDDARKLRVLTHDLCGELGDFLKCVILFGSSTSEVLHEHDIDVLLVIDDLSRVVTPEVVEAYRIIVEKTAGKISNRFHINTLKLTELWDYARNGDPVFINMLRDGVVFFDSGIFEPLQFLLKQGRIRPTKESVYNYYSRAPLTLQNADWHILQACIDLYWACIDSAHAAIMKHGDVPGSPSQVGDILRVTLVKQGRLKKYFADIFDDLYALQKDITHRRVQRVSGKQYDEYKKKADDFVDAMKLIVSG
ncbi:hypothetical protein HY486_02365 [Candidatus Woesearchaeota archaeon]|nr:hypothetical protein [Candidatus Woesearchaeota archaeon]